MNEYSKQGLKELLLIGEYPSNLDDKGRILVSSKLRNQIDAERDGSHLYLTLGANGILCMYPERCFEDIIVAAAWNTQAPDEAVVFERLSFGLGSRVELDGQGQLILSKKLRERAGLGDQITLLGVRDHIELWNSEDWEQYVSDSMAQYQKQMSQARQSLLQGQSGIPDD